MVPGLTLVVVIFALVYGMPLLGGMSGVSNDMSIALDSVGVEVASGLSFIVVIILIGLGLSRR